jgi:redox-sensitive bicupin YhaK (pirin superfamily)
METRSLRALVGFTPEGPATHDVFETGNLWSQLVCLERNQHLGPMGDPDSDAMFLVVAGEVVVQVGRRRKRLDQWETALASAGDEVTVTNASVDPAVVLVVAAPPPPPNGSGDLGG